MSASSLLPSETLDGRHIAAHNFRDIVVIAGEDRCAYAGLNGISTPGSCADKAGGFGFGFGCGCGCGFGYAVWVRGVSARARKPALPVVVASPVVVARGLGSPCGSGRLAACVAPLFVSPGGLWRLAACVAPLFVSPCGSGRLAACVASRRVAFLSRCPRCSLLPNRMVECRTAVTCPQI